LACLNQPCGAGNKKLAVLKFVRDLSWSCLGLVLDLFWIYTPNPRQEQDKVRTRGEGGTVRTQSKASCIIL